jgi:hypothetical protein
MHGKKEFFTLLAIGVACVLFSAGLHAQLIEPTRSLEGASDGAGLLSVLSEPPGLDVQLDGMAIGKTPIFSARFPPGLHVLRIEDSKIDIHLAAGKTFTTTWFKGAFIEIPERVKPSAEITQEPILPRTNPKADEKPDVQRNTANDPYYWPLNPRGPIY